MNALYIKEAAERQHKSSVRQLAELDADHAEEHRCAAVISSRKRQRDGTRPVSLSAPLKQWSDVISVGVVRVEAEEAYEKVVLAVKKTAVPSLVRKNGKVKPMADCNAIIAKLQSAYDRSYSELMVSKRRIELYEKVASGRYGASCGFSVAIANHEAEKRARVTFLDVWKMCEKAETVRVLFLKKKKKPVEPKESAARLRTLISTNENQIRSYRSVLTRFKGAQRAMYTKVMKKHIAAAAKLKKRLATKLLYTVEYADHAKKRVTALEEARLLVAARVAFVAVLERGCLRDHDVRVSLAGVAQPAARGEACDGESDSSTSSESDDDGVVRGFLRVRGYRNGLDGPPVPSLTPVYPPPPNQTHAYRVYDRDPYDEQYGSDERW